MLIRCRLRCCILLHFLAGLFPRSCTRQAPLLFAHPAHGGKVSQSFAEFVDIYPTLADLAGLPVPKTCADEAMSQSDINCTEGYSLRPLIEDGGGSGGGKPAAFSQWPKGGKMGYIIFTSMTDGSQVRYTEWVGYDKDRHGPIWADDSAGNELYGTFRLNFHRFNRFELDLRGYTQP